MSSVETGQMSAIETGQMSAIETGQMSAVETRQMLKSQIFFKINRGSGFPAKNIKFDLKWVKNRRFGLKLGPEACQDCSGAFGMGLTHSKGPSPACSWSFKSGP